MVYTLSVALGGACETALLPKWGPMMLASWQTHPNTPCSCRSDCGPWADSQLKRHSSASGGRQA